MSDPICVDELQIIYEHGQAHGIRDRHGYLMFFPTVSKYNGQEARYIGELDQNRRLAKYLLAALQEAGK